MKKLTKKSLNELAIMMPILSKIQQKTFIGVTHYYDIVSGTFLGTVGISDDVRFVTQCGLIF